MKKSLAYLIKTGHIWLVPKLAGKVASNIWDISLEKDIKAAEKGDSVLYYEP